MKFNLRSLLVLIAAVAIALAFIATPTISQIRAVKEIEATGGSVWFEDKETNGYTSFWHMLTRPQVSAIDLSDPFGGVNQQNDESASIIRKLDLSAVTHVNLDKTQVSNEFVRRVRKRLSANAKLTVPAGTEIKKVALNGELPLT
jgi:hypothetical protein